MLNNPRGRQTQVGDLPQCLEVMNEHFAFTPSERLRLQTMLKELLETHAALSGVVEAETLAGCRIVGFALNVFVEDAFADLFDPETRNCKTKYTTETGVPKDKEARDYLCKYVLWLHSKGRSPILNARQIAHANTPSPSKQKRGMNMLGLHFGWGRSLGFLTDRERNGIRDAMLATFTQECTGFHLNRYFKEVFGEDERERFLDLGCEVWA